MKRVCVIGWPITHSRSPLIHGYWLTRFGIAAEYDRQGVPPGELEAFINSLPNSEYVGCNVTLPHKERVFDLIAPADTATRTLRAVNTVFVRTGKVWGTNTDGEGFLESVGRQRVGWVVGGKSVVILGAGGSARAIIAALVAEKAGRITIANRTRKRGEQLRDELGAEIAIIPWEEAAAALRGADLLVNATSLGMAGQPPLELDISALPPHALVADIVYVPLETEFLKQARARGHHVIPGLGMLLHQAVRGFELWFGVRPVVTDELYNIVAADIAAGGLG